jgi:hypothetical protein
MRRSEAVGPCRISGTAAAFISTPPEMFYTHFFFPPSRSPHLPALSPIGNSRFVPVFVATQGDLLSSGSIKCQKDTCIKKLSQFSFA